MFCNKCTARIPDGSVFCPECGQRLTAIQTPAQIPTRQTPQYAQSQTLSQFPAETSVYDQVNDQVNAPLSVGNFFWMPVVLAIPIVGLIVLLVWAFSKGTNLNRKHYARATLIWMLISLILAVIVTLTGGGILGQLSSVIGL